MKAFLVFILSSCASFGAIWNVQTNSGWLEIPPGGGSGPVITNTITISCWLQLKTNYTSAGVLGCILDKGRTTAVPGESIYNLGVFTNKLRFQYSVSGSFHRWVMNADAPAVNAITHLAVTYTYGTGSSLKYYVNGVSMSGAWRQGDGNSIPASNAKPLWYMEDGVGNVCFAVLNEVAIWNTILTDAQIQLLAKNRIKRTPMQVSPSSLVIYHALDDLPATLANLTNSYRAFGLQPQRGRLQGFGSMTAWYEPYFSYPPNQ